MKLIYIVEDHQVIREGVRKYLELEQFDVLTFPDLKSAREAFEKKVPDLLIEDVMLPDGDGFEFVQELRKTIDIPVIFMTAKVAEEDRIHGLEIGADDYITKPFSLKELVLRVHAILRRTESEKKQEKRENRTFVSGGETMVLDDLKHMLTIDGRPVILTSAEWKILMMLIDNKGNPVSRQTIIHDCFGYESESYQRIADTHIKNLRAKLGTPLNWVLTERSIGYRFVGEEV